MIIAGDTYYMDSPPQFLTQAYGVTKQRVCLKDLVAQDAISYRVRCPLFRGVADQYGNVDVAALCFLPGATDVFDIFGEAAFSNGTGMRGGALYEPTCNVVEIPNIMEGPDWAVFYWVMAGNTLPGAELTLQLLSYRMPSSGGSTSGGPLSVSQLAQVRKDLAGRLK
jgi:hypothetical protein